MSARTMVCTGLDGGDPLTTLASLGLLAIGDQADCIERMWWDWFGAWRPVYETTVSEDELVECVLEFLVGGQAASARANLEAIEGKLRSLDAELGRTKAAVESASDRATKAAARAAHSEVIARQRELKARRVEQSRLVEVQCSAGVAQRHPVTAAALHLDDILKGGLSRQTFATIACGPSPAPYLSGLACDLHLGRKKTTIARTHLSFANNNSGKQLLKDFAALARLATADRMRDALFGNGTRRDPITGLGWDPSSQRSYALQFRDPQLDVSCQTMHHALAFIGLASLPVVPIGADRATVGVYGLPSGNTAIGMEGENDEREATPPTRASRMFEYLTWPLWSPPLSPDAVRGLLAWKELAEPSPSTDVCRAMGIVAVMRSRRFSLNKRSYLSPARPVA